ncbi:MAG TPA: hypothetical protein VEH84_13725 [Alphaproteobacteria bacterium]|nr:hypothetical protein [Alphaproteobacteria bacterium]
MVIALVVAILAALAAATVAMSRGQTRYDATTFCPAEGASGHRIVLVDRTDPLTRAQAEALKGLLFELRDGLGRFERLSVYRIGETVDTRPVQGFSFCNPGRGDQATKLYENPRLIQKTFQDRFGAPLDRLIEELMAPAEAKYSPIVETLNALADAPDFRDAAKARRLYLISDMLQHTALLDHYRSPPAPEASLRRLEAALAIPALQGASIQVAQLTQPKAKHRQTPELRRFWEEFFNRAQTKLEGWQRWPD